MEPIRLQDDDIIRRFAILEETLDFNYSEEIVIPEDLISPTMNMPEFNKITKYVMSCFGYPNVLPICGFGEEGKNTAGHTEYIDDDEEGVIKYGFPIVINVAQDAKGDSDKILAILVHEICHNVLRLYKFPILSGIENEIYTDLATIYLGLGKYTLNGHRTVKTRVENLGFQVNYHKTTSKVGYLTDDTYYRAYVLNQLFRGYQSYRKLSKGVVQGVKGGRDLSHYRNFKYLLARTNRPNSVFNDVFKIGCPKCKCVSVRPQAKLYGRLIKCSKCGHEFNFEWEFPMKVEKGAWVHSNNWLFNLFMY